MDENKVVHISNARVPSPQIIEDRLNRLRYQWDRIPQSAVELIPRIEDALSRNALAESYVLLVLAESYVIVP